MAANKRNRPGPPPGLSRSWGSSNCNDADGRDAIIRIDDSHTLDAAEKQENQDDHQNQSDSP
jgi:hypothetical protein